MAFTNEQQQLLKTRFSSKDDSHLSLLTQKIATFNQHYLSLKAKSKPIAASAMGSFAAKLFGFGSILLPVDILLWSYAAYEIHNSIELNLHYREGFSDLLNIYDWCIPNKDNLPATNITPVQNLIETMGTLVSKDRLQRLQPLINGSPEQASNLGDYARSASSSIFSAASGLFGLNSRKTDRQNIMNPATFTLLVRNLVNGKSTSTYDYTLFGEGSTTVGNCINRGINTISSLKNTLAAMMPGRNNEPPPSHGHSL